MGARNADGLGCTFAVLIVHALLGFAVHLNTPAGMGCGIHHAVLIPFTEAGTAGAGRLLCAFSLHHNIAFAAILILIVHTGLCRTFQLCHTSQHSFPDIR